MIIRFNINYSSTNYYPCLITYEVVVISTPHLIQHLNSIPQVIGSAVRKTFYGRPGSMKIHSIAQVPPHQTSVDLGLKLSYGLNMDPWACELSVCKVVLLCQIKLVANYDLSIATIIR